VSTSELPVAMIAIALLVVLAAAAAVLLLNRAYRARQPAQELDLDADLDSHPDADADPGLGVQPAVAASGAAAAGGRPDDALAVFPPGATQVPAAEEPWVPDPATALTVRFCVQLGEAMIDATSPVAQVQDAVEEVARVNGLSRLEVVALPTALLLSTPDDPRTGTVAVGTGYRTLRLDQVQDVLEVADEARTGAVRPAEGLERVQRALAAPAPYGPWQRAGGYALLAAGLGLVLGGSLVDVLLAALLGALVAGFERLTSRWASFYQGVVVLVSAFGVSVAVFSLARTGLDLTLLPALVAPLVIFLPGALLTTAVIDLATRQMIAGAARLAAGAMTLVLLALGIVGGANLVGIPTTALTAAGDQALGWAGPWVGVLAYGFGVSVRHCARRRAVPWILVVLLVAYAGQVLGGVLFGSTVSAFVGALAMTPVALVAARHPAGPPAMVSFLPAFWLLVPGALGLVGVTSVIDVSTDRGIAAVVTAGTTMVAISLGVLTGLGAGSWLLSGHRWWVRAR
jgi:uncharacterized membrane protein YjjP (DUF1212 family)